jgi:excisionase family DNA binding protein
LTVYTKWWYDKDMNYEMYTIKETAEKFRVTTRTIRRWIHDSKINAIKIGHTVRIAQEEIARIKGL